jgi:phosphatidylglycerol:prolipoprotein diacylglycerol transferase
MLLASIINWNVPPEIEPLSFGFIHLRWYGVLFALSFVVGYQIMTKIYKDEHKTDKQLESLVLTMILSTVIGARLGHCLFYAPEYYLANPLEIFKIWQGGLASHGAAVGIISALALYSQRQKIKLIWILDRIVIVVALSAFFIRLGNFFNSEIIGKPTDVPWAVVFERVDMLPRHPSQLYEGIWGLFVFTLIYSIYNKYKEKLPNGLLFGIFLICTFGFRILVEFTKENQVAFESGMSMNMGQILSIPLVILGIISIIWSFKNKNTEIA